MCQTRAHNCGCLTCGKKCMEFACKMLWNVLEMFLISGSKCFWKALQMMLWLFRKTFSHLTSWVYTMLCRSAGCVVGQVTWFPTTSFVAGGSSILISIRRRWALSRAGLPGDLKKYRMLKGHGLLAKVDGEHFPSIGTTEHQGRTLFIEPHRTAPFLNLFWTRIFLIVLKQM